MAFLSKELSMMLKCLWSEATKVFSDANGEHSDFFDADTSDL
jgi:hypothetical protein